MPNRAAIVTGARRGIGLAIAKTLAEEGYGLTITARRHGYVRSASVGLSCAALAAG